MNERILATITASALASLGACSDAAPSSQASGASLESLQMGPASTPETAA